MFSTKSTFLQRITTLLFFILLIPLSASADYRDYEGGLNEALDLPPQMHLRDPLTVNSSYDPNLNELQLIELDGDATNALCNTYEDRDGDGHEDIDYGESGFNKADPYDDNYKFMIEPGAPGNQNVMLFFEGGGGCWDYMTCTEKGGAGDNAGFIGMKENFLTNDENTLKTATRSAMQTWPTNVPHEFESQTAAMLGISNSSEAHYKDWTKIYLPYCSQDLYMGNNTPRYIANPSTSHAYYVDYLSEFSSWIKTNPEYNYTGGLKFRHHGSHITATVASWVRKNLPQPDKLLVTGQSAGGFATEMLYHYLRSTIQPNKGYMLNDAGTIFLAENHYDAQGKVVPNPNYPKDRHHPQPASFAQETLVNSQWGHRPYLSWLEQQSSGMAKPFRINNLGTISDFLSEKWPNDRLMLASFQNDYVIAGFYYNNVGFEHIDDNTVDLTVRNQNREEFRMRDMQNKMHQLDSLSNYGYYFPYYRPLVGGHMATIIGVANTTQINQGHDSADSGQTVRDAMDNLMGTGTYLKALR